MVFEIRPKLDWDKGKAVRYLPEPLSLNRDTTVPIYLGDDITNEDTFRAVVERGIGIFVGSADDPEVAGRTTAADYALNTIREVSNSSTRSRRERKRHVVG